MSGLSSGERAVWAAEFVRVLGQAERDAVKAAFDAGLAVAAMRRVSQHPDGLGGESMAMLEDMLGVPR